MNAKRKNRSNRTRTKRPSDQGLSLSTGRLEGRPTNQNGQARINPTERFEDYAGQRGEARGPQPQRHSPGERSARRSEQAARRERSARPGAERSGGRNPRAAAGRPARGGEGRPGSRAERGPQPGERGAGRPAPGRGAAGRAGARPGAPGRAQRFLSGSAASSSSPAYTASKRPRSHGYFLAFDTPTLGLIAIALALLIVIIMALTHVGPFAQHHKTADEHVGALTVSSAFVMGTSAANMVSEDLSPATPVEPALDKLPAYQPTSNDILGLSEQKAPYAFALYMGDGSKQSNDLAAPVLSDHSLVELNKALTYYEVNKCEASYLLLDLQTGRGIAGNLDAPIYGASSFKGPYCAFVAQRQLPNNVADASDYYLDAIKQTILYSDNESYEKLRSDFSTDELKEWLKNAQVNEAIADDTSFPTYSGRDSALLWLQIYQYLQQQDNSTAALLGDQFAQTEVSFIRNGILGTNSIGATDYSKSEVEGNEQVEMVIAESAEAEEKGEIAVSQVESITRDTTVRNKAGWIAGENDHCVCDSGIVSINGHDYLLTIMTSAPDSPASETAFAHLTKALLQARTDLA